MWFWTFPFSRHVEMCVWGPGVGIPGPALCLRHLQREVALSGDHSCSCPSQGHWCSDVGSVDEGEGLMRKAPR